MAKFGSSSVSVKVDDAPGGTLRDITAHVTTIGGIKKEQITEETSPFGTTNESHTPVGKHRVPDIPVEGFFDDTATTGPHVVLSDPDDSPGDATRSFEFRPGGGKVFSMECRLVDYEVLGQNGNLTKYRATIRQAGAGTWSTE